MSDTVSVTNFMLNGYLENTSLLPNNIPAILFLTVGAGAAHASISSISYQGTTLVKSASDTQLAYQAGFGTGFKIERKIGSGGTYLPLATAAANAISYNDTGLTASTAYYYQIRSTNSVGDSGYTTEVNATTQANGGGGTAPTGVTASAVGTSVNLTWNPVANAISYNVYWGTSTGVSKSSSKIPSITSPSYQHTNLTIGTTYYYVVTAYISGFVDGPVSTEVSAQNTHFPREIEPNNTTATATAIIIAGDAVRGQLSSDTDVDYYTFTSTGGVVSFTIKTDDTVPAQFSGTDIKASIIASDGTTVLSSISNISENITQIYPLSANLAAGTYYLKFENANQTSFRKDYVVSSSYNSTMNREIEPNNNQTSATPITIGGGTIRGQLSSNTDVDYYTFTSTGGMVSFTIKTDDTVPAQFSGTDIKASIIASNGTTVLSSISNISESTTQIYPLSANLTAGTYYLKFENANQTSFRKDYIVTY